MLETYGEVRRCSNIVLVAGSGFGSAADAYPYLTGEWSLGRDGRDVRMPFDGVLLGSRVMTCLEARTSPSAKAAIAAAPGLSGDGADWEKTYAGPAGGIVTVISEMGEPMHVVATRGALFWAEMDRLVFSLDGKPKRAAVLQSKRDHIIKRLNADFQKPWFAGEKKCDLADMTYLDTLRRAAELMRVTSEDCVKTWMDPSYARFFADLATRTQERFLPDDGKTEDQQQAVVSELSCTTDPELAILTLEKKLPELATTPLCAEDVHFFLQLCRRPGQKPVPFVPALDDNFETYFKKDSLWQSECAGIDAERTLILHGPVATRHTNNVDEPVGDVLGGINDGTISRLLASVYGGKAEQVPYEELFAPKKELQPLQQQQQQQQEKDSVIPLDASLSDDDLRRTLCGAAGWRNALFGRDTVVRGCDVVANPVWTLARASGADELRVSSGDKQLSFYSHGQLVLQITRENISKNNSSSISVMPFAHVTAQEEAVSLSLKFEYRPDTPYAPLREADPQHRNQAIYEMYRKLWLTSTSSTSSSSLSPSSPPHRRFRGPCRCRRPPRARLQPGCRLRRRSPSRARAARLRHRDVVAGRVAGAAAGPRAGRPAGPSAPVQRLRCGCRSRGAESGRRADGPCPRGRHYHRRFGQDGRGGVRPAEVARRAARADGALALFCSAAATASSPRTSSRPLRTRRANASSWRWRRRAKRPCSWPSRGSTYSLAATEPCHS